MIDARGFNGNYGHSRIFFPSFHFLLLLLFMLPIAVVILLGCRSLWSHFHKRTVGGRLLMRYFTPDRPRTCVPLVVFYCRIRSYRQSSKAVRVDVTNPGFTFQQDFICKTFVRKNKFHDNSHLNIE